VEAEIKVEGDGELGGEVEMHPNYNPLFSGFGDNPNPTHDHAMNIPVPVTERKHH
jgi:hypothetical protein